ncbi:MAG: tRNA 5-methoxyuridine(34)/uridine 5-oxyacetic acid(34) synthase CmoB [Luminiphilus sp.]|nr:tRNA 5-methoxyuridine(34)/uridine 5-oxyacetic acid(34) synthase CmoB [Luminiphilus sp.]
MDEIVAQDLMRLQERWRDTPLEPWLTELPRQLAQGFSSARYGDIPRWHDAFLSLPKISADTINLSSDRVGCTGSITDSERKQLVAALQGLHPWRKGPFQLFDLHLDTEWRSDWKWGRLEGALHDLSQRRVLDVGCGSGYHSWRMLGAGANEVIGIDPSPLFNFQFRAIQHYLGQPDIHVLPITLEQLPPKLGAFDTVFSMGVLYHRRSPLDHLIELRDALRSDGQLILETLVVDGGPNTVFIPPNRYARMGNVWCLPSPVTLRGWLEKVGFKNAQIVDVNTTSTNEQRSTPWMTFHSLEQFLDSENATLTAEGHAAPVRAILTADAP